MRICVYESVDLLEYEICSIFAYRQSTFFASMGNQMIEENFLPDNIEYFQATFWGDLKSISKTILRDYKLVDYISRTTRFGITIT